MNKRTIVLLAIITMAACRIFAQEFKDKEVKDFLISIQLLDKDDRCSYFAYELLTGELLKPTDKYGIYSVGAHISDNYIHLMLLKNKKKVFIEYNGITSTLEAALAFFEEKDCPFTDTQKLDYIRALLNFSELNMHIIGINKP